MIDKESLWRVCEPMREDGMPTAKYMDQLSALLFLKGAEASGKLTLYKLDHDDDLYLPSAYRWDVISGNRDVSDFNPQSDFDKPIESNNNPADMDQLEIYKEAIAHLKEDGELAQRAFDQFTPEFRRSSTFRETVDRVDALDGWDEFSGNSDLFGDAYEFLMNKYADKTEGTGEYYTPRPLIRAIVEFIEPNVDDEVIDPASGTNGFLIYAYEYLKRQTNDFANIAQTDVERQFVSRELRQRSYRYGLLNYILHDIDPIKVNAMQGDSLREEETRTKEYDLVFANPPFGSDITSKYNRKCDSTIEMNFLMMMMDLLNDSGRAGIVIPEGILFDSSKEPAREELLSQFNIDTILALPEDTFQPYSGVDANVLFFKRDSSGTDEFWFYDARSEYENIKDSNPLKYKKHFQGLVENKNDREQNERYFKVSVDDVDTDGHELHLTKYKEYKYDTHRPSKEISRDIRNELESLEKITDESAVRGKDRMSDIESKMKSIEDVAEVIYGDGLPKDDRKDGEIPVYGSGGVTGFHNESLEESTCVILGRKGSIDKVHYVEEPFWAIDTTFYVKAKDNIKPKYLYFFFDMYDLTQMDTSSTIPSLRKGDIQDIKIPVPPLEHQKQIVDEIEKKTEYTEQLTRKVSKLDILLTEYADSSLFQIFGELSNRSSDRGTYSQQQLTDENS